jgi:hypothetical protein
MSVEPSKKAVTTMPTDDAIRTQPPAPAILIMRDAPFVHITLPLTDAEAIVRVLAHESCSPYGDGASLRRFIHALMQSV